MTKSRIALIALSICCIALLGAGTAAYFTVQDTAYNVITTGILDMTLQERTAEGAEPDTPVGELPEFKDAVGVMPGEDISKIVYVDNSGTADLYARIRLSMKVTAADGTELDTEIIELDLNTADWTFADGWYYYNGSLEPGQSTPPLFTTVAFAETMDNRYQSSTAAITVEAEAVQSKNNSESALEAAGWPTAAQEPAPEETNQPDAAPEEEDKQ